MARSLMPSGAMLKVASSTSVDMAVIMSRSSLASEILALNITESSTPFLLSSLGLYCFSHTHIYAFYPYSICLAVD
jgi:hypothetical protein